MFDALCWRCCRTFCFWEVLWCGHAVLPSPSFGLVFLFHLVCSVASLALAGAILFCFLFCHHCSFLLRLCRIPWLRVWLPCSGLEILYRHIPSFPFAMICLVLVWVCLLRVLSFHFGCFWTPSFFVPRLLWLLVRPLLPFFLGVSCVRLLSGVCRWTSPSFVFMCEDILSAFDILSLVSPFLSLSGVEVSLCFFLSLLVRGCHS